MNFLKKKLNETQKKRVFIYALMYNLNNFNEKSKFVVMSQLIKNINNCFDFDKIFKLLNYKKNDYVINLIFNVEFFFRFFIRFFRKKITRVAKFNIL